MNKEMTKREFLLFISMVVVIAVLVLGTMAVIN
jgi:hypothetical protein